MRFDGEYGVWVKDAGPMLEVGGSVDLDGSTHVLANPPEEESMSGCLMRYWAVPTEGGFYSICEIVSPQ